MNNKKCRVLFYGDSNTYGFDPRGYFGGRYPESVRWTSVLARELVREWEIFADGENGRTIPENDASMQAMLSSISHTMPLDLFVIMLGSNDFLNMFEPDEEAVAKKMGKALKAVLSYGRVVQMGTRVLLIAPPQIVTGGDEYYMRYDTTNGKLSYAYKRLAQEMGVEFADAGSWRLPPAFDGVHLSEEGHRIFADKIGDILRRTAFTIHYERGEYQVEGS